jgi:hypothetical protein
MPHTNEHYYNEAAKNTWANPEHHAFMKLCAVNVIEQCFTQVRYPIINGKAEWGIKVIIEFLNDKTRFASSVYQKTELNWFSTWTTVFTHTKGLVD